MAHTPSDEQGRSILHIAAMNGYTEIIQIILSDPLAQINTQDQSGNTPLHYAIQNKRDDATIMLLDAGADVRIKNNVGLSPADMMGEPSLQEDALWYMDECLEIECLGELPLKKQEELDDDYIGNLFM